MDFQRIKLIIWDLDEVFWKGTISEERVCVPEEHVELIKNLIDCGVMVSICSKNDYKQVEKKLQCLGISNFFVFKSINWNPKGQRIKNIIELMNLRPVNVLFIDDNISNREEARHFCPDINVSDIDVIPLLISHFRNAEKADLKHKRLSQYQILEKKNKAKESCGSNEDFLLSSEIVVEIKKDSINYLDRIHELILRTNQLNFTKNRCSLEDLRNDILNPLSEHGYVLVRDKFGDYGIVGFYLIIDNVVKHFAFSCRTLGMGVEQYVYNELGKPQISIVGEVSSQLESVKPKWINCKSASIEKKQPIPFKTIIKGPCDMAQTTLYFSGSSINLELTYVNDKGVVIEQANHTSIICDSLKLSKKIRDGITKNNDLMDESVYSTHIFDNDVRLVVLSTFVDPNLGLYRNKINGAVMPFGEYTNDMTDKNNWKGLINGTLFNANYKFTNEKLSAFKEQYEYIGRMSPAQIVDNIKYIFSHLNKNCVLCLVLGSTTPYLQNKSKAYDKREIFNRELNGLLYELSKENERIAVLDVNDFIDGQDSFTDNINHFKRIVYYKMSQRLIEIANDYGLEFKTNSKFRTFARKYLRKIKNLFCHPIAVIKGRSNRRKMKTK